MDYASVSPSEPIHAAAAAAFSAPPSQASSTASSRSSSSCIPMNPRSAEERSYSSSSPVSYHPNEPNRWANVQSMKEANSSGRTSPDPPPHSSSSPSDVSTPASSVSSPSTLPSPPRWEPPPLSRGSDGAEAGLPIRAPTTGVQRRPDGGHTDASVPPPLRMGVGWVPTTDNADKMAVTRDGPISSHPGVRPLDTTDRSRSSSSDGSSTNETDEESQEGETPPPPPPSHPYLPLYSASPEAFPTTLPRLSPSSQEAALQQMGRTGRGGMTTPLENTHRYHPLSGSANGMMSTPQQFPSPSSPFPTPGAAPLPPSFSSASLSWDARMGDGLSASPPLWTSLGTTLGASVVRGGGSSGNSSSSRVEVHPAAYSDRRRLLYHITQLATQYQRAQLQVEEQQAALVLLHAHFQSLQEHIQKTEKKGRSTSSSSSTEKSREGKHERGSESENEDEEEEEEERKEKKGDDRVHVEVHRAGLTAALLMAKNESALQKQIRDRLPYFDPLLAQTQIHRLDDALAHVSLLREAELARAQQAEEVELPPLREECAALRKEVEVLQQQKTQWEQRCVVQEKQLQATTEEVERLRVEEVQLNHQLTVLQRFQNTIAGEPIPAPLLSVREDRVREMGLGVSPSSSSLSAAIWRLLVEESEARQTLWMEVFWEPIAMAFDAGLTWLLEMERRESDTQLAALQNAIREETAQRRAAYPAEVHHALRLQEEEEEVEEEKEDPARHVSPSVVSALSHPLVSRDTPPPQGISTRGGEPHHKGSPIPHGSRPRSSFSGYDYITGADADLVVLKNQQAELRDIRLQLEKSKEHEHLLTLEVSRWKSMYENEKIQATQRSESHVEQLRRAFKEIVRDRQIIKASLEWKVEQQMRAAFSDGRLYEQKLHSSKSQTVQD